MGRSNMASLKITLLPLAICLLLSLNSQVSGKPSPKHFLIETQEKARKNNDYIGKMSNDGTVNKIVDRSFNVDYTGNVNNVGGKIGGIGDGSWNHGDYTGNVNNVGGKIGGIGDGNVNSGDYTGNVKNVGGKIGGIGDGSWNHDYTGNVNNHGGSIGGVGDGSINIG